MTDEKNDGSQMDGFALGRPALVCRWRLAGRALPLENRHLRALGRRLVAGGPVSKQLVAWAKQHIEWTLADGAARHPDGVLMLVLDETGRAAMTVGPYEPLAVTTSSALAERAQLAAREAAETGVAPETLWVVRGDVLVAGCPIDQPLSGVASLVADLAKTTGVPVSREADLARRVMNGDKDHDELLLVSDEHGVVPASDAAGAHARRLADGYARLLETTRRQQAGARRV